MRAFMTTGTTHFLKNIIETHPDKEFYLMKSGTATLVYYEDTKKKGIFVSGRSYDIIHSVGTIQSTGFVVMDHIPVSEEETPVFEERTSKQLSSLGQAEGILAAKLLKELKSNQFVIITQWKSERDHHNWQKEEEKNELNFSGKAKLPAYFMDRPFTNHYYMLKEEEENEE